MANCVAIWKGKVIKPVFLFFLLKIAKVNAQNRFNTEQDMTCQRMRFYFVFVFISIH